MGYTTDFNGGFDLNKTLHPRLKEYLIKFNESRRMKRNLPVNQFGIDGEFFVEGDGFRGQDKDDSVVDYNIPPSTQPGLWCQWVPDEDGNRIVWDGGEKFYDYCEWIVYIVQNFLAPYGYVLNGEITYQGEDPEDFGLLIMTDNVLSVRVGGKKLGKPKVFKSSMYKDQVTFAIEHIFEAEVLEKDVTPLPKLLGSSSGKI